MRALTKLAAALVLSANLVGGSAAASFAQLVVFGDSLSDAGDAAAITGGVFPPSPFPCAGSSSNGPTAAQYLAQTYGVTIELGWPVPTAGSNNFAVLGGRNGTWNCNIEIDSPAGLGAFCPTLASTGITSQIGLYASQHAAGVPGGAATLFMVWGGPNDRFLRADAGGEPAGYVPALNDLADDIQWLADMGGQHILVPSMPELGLTPAALVAGPATSAGLSLLSAAYNDGLDAVLTGLGAALGPLDIHRSRT